MEGDGLSAEAGPEKLNKPVRQVVEEEEKMDEAVSLYFAGQSSDDIDLGEVGTWEV